MELPPGWRGYGARDYIDHPDTAARLAEVEAVRRQHADRFARQQALLPFEHQLPPRLRGRNERINERFDERTDERTDERPDDPPAGPPAAAAARRAG
jgi:hypothetical protein